ncbi:hypothetical protein ECDEC7D_1468 [Escherichia coli DEC7D]|nr:hypothetical protein ECDEC7D_1468 [Escherichia coli DEC7D]
MDQVVVFQKMFEQVRKEQKLLLVLFRIKTSPYCTLHLLSGYG